MRSQSRNEVIPVETFFQYLVECKQAVRDSVFQKSICQSEIIFIVQYIQVLYYTLVSDMSVGKAYHLVENRQGVTHTSISLLCNHVQCFRFGFDMFLSCHVLQMFYRVAYTDTIEVVYLATAQNGRKNLMLFGCSKNEDGVMRRFFQRFQEGIECSLRKHVHLIDDVYFIFSDLWRDTNLLNQRTYILHRVVRCGIQFMNII